MKLNICHLLPDLLNLYGDGGNITILQYRAKARGMGVAVHGHKSGGNFDKDLYDIVLLGGGGDFETGVALGDLKKSCGTLIGEYIEDGGVFLAVGSGYQMLGEYFINPLGEKIAGLGILPFYTESADKKFVGNISTEIDGETCVGFENHAGKTYIGDLAPLGKVLNGFGNNGEDGGEGIRYKNTFCTYLHGPFLSKNPKIADLTLETALKRRYENVLLSPLDDEYEINAKQAVLKRLARTR